MLGKKITVGIGSAVVASASLMTFASAAHADYAPSSNDVVGVGSDTVQLAGDFLADGDHLGDLGYNNGKKNKFISIDATADANTRLAYGVNGLSSTCTPGTGGTAGTGNQNATHSESVAVCTLNPTVVLRAGTSPVQRPNGSGAGYNALKNDTDSSGNSITNTIDFARRSSAANAGAGETRFDSVTIGNDPFGMLSSSTSNAVPLSIAQLKKIYTCDPTADNWTEVGGSVSAPIKPLVPQVGSGTRDYFLKAINGGVTFTPGSCVQAAEENDPEAIGASGDEVNAIEPMSLSRLYASQGKLSDGTANGVGGYFQDPSCAFGVTAPAPACTTGKTLTPNVKFWDATTNPTASDGGATFNPTRPLFIYFRHNDIASIKKFQPGGTLNWIKTMLYNPGGATPFACGGSGQALISAAGIVPACTYTSAGP